MVLPNAFIPLALLLLRNEKKQLIAFTPFSVYFDQVLEQNLPMNDAFKSKDVTAAPIRVTQLLYNAGVCPSILKIYITYQLAM